VPDAPPPYPVVPFRSFGGGLNLRDRTDSLDESQALDVLNVLFTERGSVKQREGYAKFTSSEGTNRYDSLSAYYRTGSANQIVAGAGNRLEGINVSGGIVASSTAPTASPHYFARHGTPTAERLYIANGTDTVRYWDGSAFTTPAYTGTTPTGRFLAVQSPDNRLVCARTATNTSRVLFSDSGDPSIFGANNYVDITPGDGEPIMGLIAWREYLFAFKETKFAVFYGNSTDSTGAPVFNYRLVNTGIGLAASRALCAGRDGVYFLGREGVYSTTGDAPTLLSDLVDPLFHGNPSIYFKSNTLNPAQITLAAMDWYDERLYLSLPTGSATANDLTAVYDPQYRWWSLYSLPMSDLCVFRISSRDELVFAYASGTKHLARYYEGSGYTADDMSTTGTGGSAITARWRSGWFDYGSSDVKTIRETKLWGSGTPNIVLYHDFRDAGTNPVPVVLSSSSDTWGDGTGTDTWGDGSGTDLWGPATGTQGKLARVASRGMVFSTELKNSTLNKSFAVQRLDHHLRESRIPSVVQTEA
jgi:hypothetical protein